VNVNGLSTLVAQAATSPTGSSSTNSSDASNGVSDPNLFITLLTAQLQAQDPLDPMSPEDMVSQLTEVSSLQQLVSINQTLTDISTGTTPPQNSQPNPLGSI